MLAQFMNMAVRWAEGSRFGSPGAQPGSPFTPQCERAVEIQAVDAIRLYGGKATWKDVARRLLNDTCQQCTGRHEEDGCWPGIEAPAPSPLRLPAPAPTPHQQQYSGHSGSRE
jgi:hypothetical protein